MNSLIRTTAVAMVGVVGPFIWEASVAQSASPSVSATRNTSVLEEVVITAQRREESLKDVPMSVTALTGSELDDRQAREFSDFAAMVPGLSLASVQPGFTRLTLRGQNAGGVGSTVGVYVDESPFGSSTALLNGSINTGDFDTWDLQRIEVLRGPQGTLYGANSEGGLLKFVTNAPVLASSSVAGEASGESVANGGTGGDVRAVVNIPLGDKVAFRISGFYQDVPGYVDDPSRGQSDVNNGHKYGGRASLLIAPTDDLSVRLTAVSQISSYDGNNQVDVDPATLKPLYGDLTHQRALSEPSSFRYENYNATVDWNIGRLSLLSTTSYGILNTDTVTDVTPLYGGLAGLLFGGSPGAPLYGSTELGKFTQEIRLASPATDKLEWQIGGYFTHEIADLTQNLTAVALPGGASLGLLIQPVIESTYKESAGFADLTYHFNSKFDINAGGRWSANSQTANQTVTFNPALSPDPQIVNGDSGEHVWTYSVAPRWHVDTNTMLYARLATGYRPGGPNVVPPGAPADVQREYGSDRTTNVELGVKTTQLDGRLSIDVAAYHVDWKDIQLFEVVNGFGINGNGGTARSQGFEWEIGYLPVQGLTFQ